MHISVVLCGTGGYGGVHMRHLLEHGASHDMSLVAAVDPYPQSCPVPVYGTLEQALDAHTAQLVIISSPIAFHRDQTLLALSRGCHVLCEKPLAATVADCEAIAAARDAAGRRVGVGFQWSYELAMLQLKSDVLSGRYGRPVSLKARVLWPRTAAYYRRGGGWAGRMYDAQGRPIFDSVASNATAHYLYNMLWLLGDDIGAAAAPRQLQACLYRANPIETFDTAFISLQAAGADIHFYATHAVPHERHPAFEYTFTNGRITYDAQQRTEQTHITGYVDGQTIDYGDPYANEMRKLWVMADAIRNPTAPLPCTVESATQLTRAIAMAHDSMTPLRFPDDLLHQEGELTWVEGLEDMMLQCYDNATLPNLTLGRRITG